MFWPVTRLAGKFGGLEIVKYWLPLRFTELTVTVPPPPFRTVTWRLWTEFISTWPKLMLSGEMMVSGSVPSGVRWIEVLGNWPLTSASAGGLAGSNSVPSL